MAAAERLTSTTSWSAGDGPSEGRRGGADAQGVHPTPSFLTGYAAEPSGTGFQAHETRASVLETRGKYRLRLVDYPGVLSAESQIDWQGKRYSIDGEPKVFNCSRRTAHVTGVLVGK
jgi:hypothetical protein